MSQLKTKWYVMRKDASNGIISTADAALTSAQKKWSYLRDTLSTSEIDGLSYRVPRSADQVEIAFTCKNADTDTFTAVIYAAREKGDLEFVCSLNGTAGAQESDGAFEGDDYTTTRYYADTFASTADRWPADVFYIDAAGNDGIGKVVFDLRERRHVVCLFTAISANDDVRPIISWT